MNMYDDDFDTSLTQVESETNMTQELTCPRCVGGCGYCLMLEW